MRGYDQLGVNAQLLLDLPTCEFVGVLTLDRAKPHHPLGLTGTPVWTQLGNDLNYLEYDAATPDFMDCAGADTADLDFTSGAFSMAAWVSPDALDVVIMCRGLDDTDGWQWEISADGESTFRTNQAAASQDTLSTAIVVADTWAFLVVTRAGAVVTPFINGVARLQTAGTHVNPLTSARELHVGVDDTEAALELDGSMWRPRIWGRALSAAEVATIFHLERGLFGV